MDTAIAGGLFVFVFWLGGVVGVLTSPVLRTTGERLIIVAIITIIGVLAGIVGLVWFLFA